MLENLIYGERLSFTKQLKKQPGSATEMYKVTKQLPSPLMNDIFKLGKEVS